MEKFSIAFFYITCTISNVNICVKTTVKGECTL